MKKLTDQRTLDKGKFQTMKDTIVSRFTQLVYNTRQGVVPPKVAKSSLINEIRKTKNNLKTEIGTRINGFKQLARNEYARVLGIEKFQYVGPIDAKTRDFCKHHTGEVKTKAEWDSLDNGQKNPVSVYRGGYNCRHSLVGVRDIASDILEAAAVATIAKAVISEKEETQDVI